MRRLLLLAFFLVTWKQYRAVVKNDFDCAAGDEATLIAEHQRKDFFLERAAREFVDAHRNDTDKADFQIFRCERIP